MSTAIGDTGGAQASRTSFRIRPVDTGVIHPMAPSVHDDCMKTVILTPLMIACLVNFACSEHASQDKARRSQMLTRSWSGDEFFPQNVKGSTARIKDYVATLEFRDDGSYFLYKFSMDGFGKTGEWKLDSQGTGIFLEGNDGQSESLRIRELTSSSLVLGDTNVRGYNLVPLRE